VTTPVLFLAKRAHNISVIEGVRLKKIAEKPKGIGKPHRLRTARQAKPLTLRFEDDGFVPNNSALPLVLYRGAVRLDDASDPAAVYEALFQANGWGDAWRDSIYDFVHYHPGIHEVLGVARGHALVQFGGPSGRELETQPGDIAILPAGTGHRCLRASDDLLVVGAYPPTGEYEEYRATKEEHDRALAKIINVALPQSNPVYGPDGPLVRLWRDAR
jgi:uncharacterized protein YjlB